MKKLRKRRVRTVMKTSLIIGIILLSLYLIGNLSALWWGGLSMEDNEKIIWLVIVLLSLLGTLYKLYWGKLVASSLLLFMSAILISAGAYLLYSGYVDYPHWPHYFFVFPGLFLVYCSSIYKAIDQRGRSR